MSSLKSCCRIFAVLTALFALGAEAVAGDDAAGQPTRHLRLQLKWTHAFQFAGYYAAIKEGYFRDAGLDVELLEGGPSINPSDAVAGGGAEFGVGNSSILVDRARGLPLVAVATIFQHSPFVILARNTPALRTVHDLVGHTVMVEKHAAELTAYLASERIASDRLRIIPHTGDALALAHGVDAMTAYSTSEPYDLDHAGIPFQVFTPRSAGIDFYGDTLFTSTALARSEPDLVRAMAAATEKGWTYAINHSDEIIDEILLHYASRHDRQRLQFEARETIRLMAADVVDIGYMSPGRWRSIADGFAAVGLVPKDMSLEGFLFEAVPKPPDLRWLYAVLTASITFGLAVTLIARHFHRLNRRLTAEIISRRRLETELAHLATTDPLTDLLNRRHFDQRAGEEFRRAARLGQQLAVLMIDIDRFKSVNDRWGHATGDQALTAVAATARAALRDIDVVGRYGGEEFAALLPGTDRLGAIEAGERIRRAVSELVVMSEDGQRVMLTASIGIALLNSADESFSRLLARADAALYQAKHEGRDRVVMSGQADAEWPGNGIARLVWRDLYACGHPAIDGQHRLLFDKSNDLLDAVMSGRPKDEVGALLAGLLEEVAAHFSDEEMVIRAAGYPGVDEHRGLHLALVGKARLLSADGDLPLGQLFAFLAHDVVAIHMLSEDRKFFPYIAALMEVPVHANAAGAPTAVRSDYSTGSSSIITA